MLRTAFSAMLMDGPYLRFPKIRALFEPRSTLLESPYIGQRLLLRLAR